MAYLREIEVVVDVASLANAEECKKSADIDVWYIATDREQKPLSLQPEQEFILQSIRDQVRMPAHQDGDLPQATLSRILNIVASAWDQSRALSRQIRLLNLTFPTAISKTSDTSISVKTSLLVVPLQTKVVITIGVTSRPNEIGNIDLAIAPRTEVIYGEQFNAPKMGEFLATRIGPVVVAGDKAKDTESWGDIAEELKMRLIARGRKGTVTEKHA